MNEERKPKKLNIKKIAVVALSVIMIMATFCMSAFADNPLTTKTKYTIRQSSYPIFDNQNIINFTDSDRAFMNEAGNIVTIKFKKEDNTIIEADNIGIYNIYTDNEEQLITLDIGIETLVAFEAHDGMYERTISKELEIIGSYSEDGEYTAEESAEIINDKLNQVLTEINNSQVDDMFSNITAQETSTIGILSTFTSIGTWISGAVSTLIGMFYQNGSLTFIGYLAVAALAVSVIFLLVYLISSFLKFRG